MKKEKLVFISSTDLDRSSMRELAKIIQESVENKDYKIVVINSEWKPINAEDLKEFLQGFMNVIK